MVPGQHVHVLALIWVGQYPPPQPSKHHYGVAAAVKMSLCNHIAHAESAVNAPLLLRVHDHQGWRGSEERQLIEKPVIVHIRAHSEVLMGSVPQGFVLPPNSCLKPIFECDLHESCGCLPFLPSREAEGQARMPVHEVIVFRCFRAIGLLAQLLLEVIYVVPFLNYFVYLRDVVHYEGHFSNTIRLRDGELCFILHNTVQESID